MMGLSWRYIGLRVHASTVVGSGSIPGQGDKILWLVHVC